MPHKPKSNESKKRSHHKDKTHEKDREYAGEQVDRGREYDRRDGKSRDDDSVPREGVSISPSRPVKPNPPPPPPKKREEEWEPEPNPHPPIYADKKYEDSSTQGQYDVHSYTPMVVEQDETIEVQIGRKRIKARVDRTIKDSFISENETGSWTLSSTNSSKRYKSGYGTAKSKVKVPIGLPGQTPEKEYLYVLRHGFKGIVIGSDLASWLAPRTSSQSDSTFSTQHQDPAPTQQFSGPTSTLPYHTLYSSTLNNQSSHNEGISRQLQTPSTNYYPPSTTSSYRSDEYTHQPEPSMDSNASDTALGTSQPPYSSQTPYTSQTPYVSQAPYSSQGSYGSQTPYISRPTTDGPSQTTSYDYPPASSPKQDEGQTYANVPQFQYAKLK